MKGGEEARRGDTEGQGLAGSGAAVGLTTGETGSADGSAVISDLCFIFKNGRHFSDQFEMLQESGEVSSETSTLHAISPANIHPS